MIQEAELAEPAARAAVARGAVAEGLAVLIGILLAFAIDAGWEERGERATERELLTAVQNELVDARAGFVGNKARLEQTSGRGTEVLRALGTSTPGSVSNDSVIVLSRVVSPPPTYYPPRAALDDLTGSGGIALVQSDSVRRAIAAYERTLSHDLQKQELLLELWRVELAPYLYRHSTVAPSDGVLVGAGDLAPRPSSVDRSAYLGNRTYLNLVSAQSLRIRDVGNTHDQAIGAIDHVLELLAR